jgi:hypothetical protein
MTRFLRLVKKSNSSSVHLFSLALKHNGTRLPRVSSTSSLSLSLSLSRCLSVSPASRLPPPVSRLPPPASRPPSPHTPIVGPFPVCTRTCRDFPIEITQEGRVGSPGSTPRKDHTRKLLVPGVLRPILPISVSSKARLERAPDTRTHT